jgi:predicted O-methyltransferase YrrM
MECEGTTVLAHFSKAPSHVCDGSGFQIGKTYVEPIVLLNDLVDFKDTQDFTNLKAEYSFLSEELRKRYADIGFEATRGLGVGDNTSLLLYLMIRLLEPTVLVETGVAKGHSTFFILKALSANHSGTLWSTEISQKCGELIREDEKDRWRLEVLETDHRKKSFEDFLKKIGKVDFFMHDGDHSYSWQMFEYRTMLPKMSPKSVLASDDINSSYAFLDFAESLEASPLFLIDISESRRFAKMFGLLKPDGGEIGY